MSFNFAKIIDSLEAFFAHVASAEPAINEEVVAFGSVIVDGANAVATANQSNAALQGVVTKINRGVQITTEDLAILEKVQPMLAALVQLTAGAVAAVTAPAPGAAA